MDFSDEALIQFWSKSILWLEDLRPDSMDSTEAQMT